jgi:Mg-chelatase subunit ChlI
VHTDCCRACQPRHLRHQRAPGSGGKIQVGLFNILQEGDVQIKGYPIRLKLDVMLVFTANPEDYTARGKIITPLKDRIGSEIRTHYPATRQNAMAITRQEAWTDRPGGLKVEIPDFVREVVEEVAFQARSDRKIDKRSGVSQRLPITTLELVVSNERRAANGGRHNPRASPIYAALPSITAVRAGIRGRAARGRADRARPHSIGGRQRLHRHLRWSRHADRDRMVRPRRIAAAQRRDVGGRSDRTDGRRPGAA